MWEIGLIKLKKIFFGNFNLIKIPVFLREFLCVSPPQGGCCLFSERRPPWSCRGHHPRTWDSSSAARAGNPGWNTAAESGHVLGRGCSLTSWLESADSLLSLPTLNVTNHKVFPVVRSPAPLGSEIPTQHLVFFRLQEKDKNESVFRKQGLQHGWWRGRNTCFELDSLDSYSPSNQGYKDTTWACCHPPGLPLRHRMKSQARLLLNRVLSWQLVQQYTLGATSIPFVQNTGCWRFMCTGRHLWTRPLHFGYLILFFFFKHTRITFKVLYKWTCWKSDVIRKLFKEWTVTLQKTAPPQQNKTKQMFSLVPSLVSEEVTE